MIRPALAALALLCGARVSGHPEIEAGLARLNAAIAAAPADAALYLERGELYAKHHDWLAAEANYLRAAELSPSLPRLDRSRGALALATGDHAQARALFDRALRADPADGEALVLRARTHVAAGDTTAAVRDLDAAIASIAHPPPELFLERAALLPPAAALRSLDAAIARLGPAHVLMLRALELEEASGQIDAALARLDRLAGRSEGREAWLKRRGDLLARAGRPREARDAYAAALAAVTALPDWLRASPATASLESELRRLCPVPTS